MATAKFKTSSPYVKIDQRQHDESDWKYSNYLSSLASESRNSSQCSKIVVLALFGLGRAGTIHLNNLLANREVKIKYIIDGDAARCKSVKDRLNLSEVRFLQPAEADLLYQDEEVNAVIVATPTYTHEEYITRSLEAGKAVFTEKPVSENTEAVDRLYQLAAKMNQPLFCAFNRRFDPGFSDVRAKIRQGQLGQVQQIKLTSRDSPLPSVAYLKISGGIFHDCMVHDIDLMTYILGEYPVQVFTIANAMIPEVAELNDHDNVVSTFKFASGTIGVVDISRFASYGYDQRLEVFGPGGMLQVDNDKPNSSIHYNNVGISKAPMFWSFPSRHAQGYVNELEHFVEVAKGVSESSVTHRMTMAVSKIADAAEASARSGQPVDLQWAADEIPDGYVMKPDL